MTSEALSLSDSKLPRVQISVGVVFNVLNAYCRRNTVDSRVIGALLGEVNDNVVTITECFVVPFNESPEDHVLTINAVYFKIMYACHRRNQRKEVLVGWFSTSMPTGALLADNSSLAHAWFSSEVANPVHIVVDTTLLGDAISVRGFVARDNTVGGESLSNSFQEIAVKVDASDAEASVLHHLINGQRPGREFASSTVTAEMKRPDKVRRSVQQLKQLIDKLQVYVDAVVAGTAAPNREVGILLSDALTAFAAQPLTPQQIAALQTRYQDLLMTAYLASLTQTQAVFAEKVNHIL
jgi:translation initiation factor 3 subunit F